MSNIIESTSAIINPILRCFASLCISLGKDLSFRIIFFSRFNTAMNPFLKFRVNSPGSSSSLYNLGYFFFSIDVILFSLIIASIPAIIIRALMIHIVAILLFVLSLLLLTFLFEQLLHNRKNHNR